MWGYSLALEVFLYGSAVYLFLKKKELVIIYLPMLFFTLNLVGSPVIRSVIWYATVTGILLYCAARINPFRRPNYAAKILLFYFTILFLLSHDLAQTRSSYLSMLALIGAVIIGPNLYATYGRDRIFSELYKMSYAVLILFVGNCILSSVTGYAPRPLYGHTTGVLYGNMGPTAFMLVPVALFIFLAHNFKKTSIFDVGLAFCAFAFAAVSMRRTVIIAAFLAVGGFMLMLLLEKDKRKFLQLTALVTVVTAVGVLFTDLTSQFSQRYEGRFQEKEVVDADEGRFTDHQLVFDDIFVHERYSALWGFGFFNSSGNYGGGIHGNRSLHPDIPVIIHASGLVGLGLYLAMVATAFLQSWRGCYRGHDKILWCFCLLVFAVFTFSGRITETAYAMGLFLLLFLPMANHEEPVVPAPQERVFASTGSGAR